MKKTTIFLVLIVCHIYSSENESKIKKLIIENCTYNMAYGYSFDELKEWVNKDINPDIKANEIEHILFPMAKDEFNSYIIDTNKGDNRHYLLFCISSILQTCNNKKSNDFIKMLFHSGDPRLVESTLEHMILKSDEWFKCAKNIIDSAEVKNGSLRFYLYNYLIFKVNNTPKGSPQFDSLKYLIYNAMVNENWGKIYRLDQIYTEIDSNYVFSKQRLNILTKFDNPKVKEHINIRKKEKYAEKKKDLYLDTEIIYNTYLKLKKQKNRLKDYNPPEL